jgi:hypothetical protein
MIATAPATRWVRRTRAAAADAPLRWRVVLVLLPLLPLFGESFHYVKGLLPLWALSKAFPLLSLPLALVLFRDARPVVSRQMLLSLLWFFLVPSLTAIFTFQQDFFTGLTAQVKLLPMLYFFSLLGLLRWLRPTQREIATGFMICAAVTFVLLFAFWIAAPQSWYVSTYHVGDSPIFSSDNRGNRIRMPMYFGLIGIFYCLQRVRGGRSLAWVLPAAGGFLLVLFAVRTRAMVLGLAGTAVVSAFLRARPRMRLAVLLLLPLFAALLFTVPYVRSVVSTDAESGFDVRWITFGQALDVLGTSPLHWLLGVGTISPLDPAGLINYFNHFFFLADITWLGVVFEYGLIGALLFLLLPVRGLMVFRSVGQARRTPFLASLQDFLLYAIVISPLYPLTLAPGEIAVILAILVYALDAPAPELRGRYGR